MLAAGSLRNDWVQDPEETIMKRGVWVLALVTCLTAPSAVAQNANTDWHGSWGFDSPSERSVDLRAAELIEAKQGGLLERQDQNIVSNVQSILCNANASTGGLNEGTPQNNQNTQGAGNAAVSGCAVEGGTFAPATDNTNNGEQPAAVQPAQSQFQDFSQ